MRNDFVTDFMLFRAARVLDLLQVEPHLHEKILSWCWRYGNEWAESCNTQSEFDHYIKLKIVRYAKDVIPRYREFLIQEQPTVPLRQPAWTPCKHWNPDSQRQCEHCKNSNAGDMVRAQTFYEKYHRYVYGIVLDRCRPRLKVNQSKHELTEDIVNHVWHHVASVISKFDCDPDIDDHQKFIFSWLRTVTENAVKDFFKGEYADKRGKLKTVQLSTENVTIDAVYPRPTQTADTLNWLQEKKTNFDRKQEHIETRTPMEGGYVCM